MNKKLLSIACVASLAISASAASDPGITMDVSGRHLHSCLHGIVEIMVDRPIAQQAVCYSRP